MPRPAIFLDRDDTLIENASLPPESWAGGQRGDLCDPAFVRPLSGAVPACQQLHAAGFCLIVVSNQGLVARGHGTLDQVDATNAALRLAFLSTTRQPLFAAIYYAPHHPQGTIPPYDREHPWRKPAPGMFLAARRAFDIDLARSWSIGDKPRDLEAGRRAGIPVEQLILVTPEFNLQDAAARVLSPPSDR